MEKKLFTAITTNLFLDLHRQISDRKWENE